MFTGFPIAALDFYEDLESDNSKAFWTAHRTVYDESVRAPMLALLDALEPEFGPGKVFRPYRDVRFAKDKSPYKTHQGGYVEACPGVGYYVQVDARGLLVAGGHWAHTPERVARYRAAVDADLRGGQLETLTSGLESVGFEIGGDCLKTAPRGVARDHPRIALMRHRSLTGGLQFTSPDWLGSTRTLTEVRGAWDTLRPLIDWFTDVLG